MPDFSCENHYIGDRSSYQNFFFVCLKIPEHISRRKVTTEKSSFFDKIVEKCHKFRILVGFQSYATGTGYGGDEVARPGRQEVGLVRDGREPAVHQSLIALCISAILIAFLS